MDFQIRSEETKDVDQVREVLKAAFPTDAESRLKESALRRLLSALMHNRRESAHN
jgi:predicted N-acetyltransferase YhbS